MHRSLRTVAVLLLVTMANALSGAQTLAFPAAQAVPHRLHLHPVGCHSQESRAPKLPSPLPASYQCCVNGHHVAVPNATFTLRSVAAQLCSLASSAILRFDFISCLRCEDASGLSTSPPSTAPLRI
jgi:hypothetical protein